MRLIVKVLFPVFLILTFLILLSQVMHNADADDDGGAKGG